MIGTLRYKIRRSGIRKFHFGWPYIVAHRGVSQWNNWINSCWTLFKVKLIDEWMVTEYPKCPQEPRQLATKSLEQSVDNKQGRATRSHGVPAKPARERLIETWMFVPYTWIFGLWGTFNLTESELKIQISVWIFLCILSGCLAICV